MCLMFVPVSPPGLAIRFGLANCLIHIDKRGATGVHAPDMANIACIFKVGRCPRPSKVLSYYYYVHCDYCRRKTSSGLRLKYHLGFLMVLYRNEMPGR